VCLVPGDERREQREVTFPIYASRFAVGLANSREREKRTIEPENWFGAVWSASRAKREGRDLRFPGGIKTVINFRRRGWRGYLGISSRIGPSCRPWATLWRRLSFFVSRPGGRKRINGLIAWHRGLIRSQTSFKPSAAERRRSYRRHPNRVSRERRPFTDSRLCAEPSPQRTLPGTLLRPTLTSNALNNA